MKKIAFDHTLEEWESIDELSEKDRELMNTAIQSVNRASASYSGFHVGCALRLENERVVIGANQEHAALSETLCAERVACFTSKTQYPGIAVEAIAISANLENHKQFELLSPCGSCRQVLFETEQSQGKNIRLIMQAGNGKIYVSSSIKNLLPFGFWVSRFGE